MLSIKFEKFIKDKFSVLEITADRVIFCVKTPFIKQMIEQSYSSIIKSSIVQTLGQDYPFEIVCLDKSDSNPTGPIEPSHNINQELKNKPQPQKVEDVKFKLNLKKTTDDLNSKIESTYIEHLKPEQRKINIEPAKTFESFVIGPSNNMAYATTQAVAENPGKSGKYPCLYLHSNSGLGKTHLLHAMANKIQELHPELVVTLITTRDFINEMIESIRANKIHEFRRKYSETIDVLMIDDIHELKQKEGTQNEFFHVFNELHNKGKQLIFTSDKSPKEIVGIEERIKTRLQWGLVIDIQKPDLETRIAILKHKAAQLDLYLQDDVINLIACSVKTSIRELEGSLVKIKAFSELMNLEIDAEIVKDLMKINKQENAQEKATLDSIAKATSKYYGIPVADLKSKSRNQDVTKARFVAMYLSRKVINSTQKEIGHFYGGRDHTSVIHALKNITSRLKTDQAISKDIITIEDQL
jgi:chromosomal replication initiator protein